MTTSAADPEPDVVDAEIVEWFCEDCGGDEDSCAKHLHKPAAPQTHRLYVGGRLVGDSEFCRS